MLHVYVERKGPRVDHIIRHILEGMLGWEWTLIEDLSAFVAIEGPKLYYGHRIEVGDAICVPASGFLTEHDITEQCFEFTSHEGMPVFGPAGKPFDVFSATFYLLSLYEECLDRKRDEHGRLPSTAHCVVKAGLEKRPLVDEWALWLAERITQRWPRMPAVQRRYAHWITVDVDNGTRYLGLSAMKHIGATIRDVLKLDIGQVLERWHVVRGNAPDPYDGIDHLIESVVDKADRVIMFYLLRGHGKFDHAHGHTLEHMEQRIQAAAIMAEVGIHPSYNSVDDPRSMRAEKARLEQVIGRPVTCSRQHFLRRNVPLTFRDLESEGITEEHSIGFRDRIGFSAGTCTPFPRYDLQSDARGSSLMVPFAVMDSALMDAHGMPQQDAVRSMRICSDTVRAVHGTFVSVWHDRVLSGHGKWKGMPERFLEVVEHARS